MFLFYIFILSLPSVRADGWTDFSNNLASDLAPFLALFGEQVTKQYLSECINPIDYFIFAMAPIGILTAVVSAIRVCGSPSLRAFIGRAQEGDGNAESELCSSTSRDVCELFNKGGGIARVFGRPKILEIIFDPTSRNDNESNDKAGIYTFQEHVDNHKTSWHLEGKTKWTSPHPMFAPNLSLNVGMKKGSPFVFWAVGLGGFILQLGVLVFAVIATYYFEWEIDGNRIESYACPLVIIGTLLLCGGMFLCAYLVGQSTDEEVWRRVRENAPPPAGQGTDEEAGSKAQTDESSFFWVQPGGQVIGDQTFDAFCLGECDNQIDRLREYTTSWKDSSQKSEFAVWAAVGITMSGFVLQFTGLRGIHSSVSVVQLGVTMLMSAARAALRMKRLDPDANYFANCSDGVIGHELDSLALRLGQVDMQKSTPPNTERLLWKFCSVLDVNERIVKTSPYQASRNTAAKVFAYRTRLAQLTKSLPTVPRSARNARNFDIEMVEMRQKSQQLATAILSAIKIVFSKHSRMRDEWKDANKVCWRIGCIVSRASADVQSSIYEEQSLYLELTRSSKTSWKLRNEGELEALLGLWVWSLKRGSTAADIPAQRLISTSKIIAEDVLNAWLGRDQVHLSAKPLHLEASHRCHPKATIWPVNNEHGQMDPPNQHEARYFGWYGPKLLRTDHENKSIQQEMDIWSVPSSSSLVQLCCQEAFGSFFASILDIIHHVGTVDIGDHEQPLLAERELVSEIMGAFIEAKLGSREDALLCILPPIINPLHQTPLIAASGHWNKKAIQELKKGEYDPNEEDEEGRRALCWATRNRRDEVVKELLLNKDIDINLNDKEGRTPLSWAAENGDETIVKLLLDTGANLDAKDENKPTPLLWAAQNGHDGVVKLIFEFCEADSSAPTIGGRTGLSWAAQKGDIEIVELLLNTKQINPDAKDLNGWTPLSWAAQNGHETVATLLLKSDRVEPDTKDDSKRTPLSWAASNGHEEIAELLLEHDKVNPDTRDIYNRTPLLWAALSGHETIVSLLLDTDRVEPDAKDDSKRTPLSWAASSGYEEIVEILLQHDKVNPDAKDEDDITPLSWAAQQGHDTVVDLLVGSGKVDVNSIDYHKRTPLLWAVQNGRLNVVERLVKLVEIDPNAEDDQGQTPLWLAVLRRDSKMVELLLQPGKIDPGVKGPNGMTPFWQAAVNHINDVAADTKEETKEFQSGGLMDIQLRAIHELKEEKKLQIKARLAQGLEQEEAIITELLGNEKVEPNAKDKNGRTVLSRAAEKGNEKMVELLLKSHRVVTNVTDDNGRTPLSLAEENGHQTVIELLQRHMK